MSKPKKLTKEQIVNIAKSRGIFIQDKLSYRNQYLKPITKQLVKEGKLKIKSRGYRDIVFIPL